MSAQARAQENAQIRQRRPDRETRSVPAER